MAVIHAFCCDGEAAQRGVRGGAWRASGERHLGDEVWRRQSLLDVAATHPRR